MKAIICGGRHYSDLKYLNSRLDHCYKWWSFSLIITGGATGADSLANQWANTRNLNTLVIFADWELHGNSAGIIRNKLMLDQKPDVVIAFSGGNGTENMITISRNAGVPVFII